MYKQMFDLSGRVAVITGGGRNIGLATCMALAECGAKVVIAEIDPAVGESGVAEMKAKGYQAELVQLDVTKPADVTAAAGQKERLFALSTVRPRRRQQANGKGARLRCRVRGDSLDESVFPRALRLERRSDRWADRRCARARHRRHPGHDEDESRLAGAYELLATACVGFGGSMVGHRASAHGAGSEP